MTQYKYFIVANNAKSVADARAQKIGISAFHNTAVDKN